MASIRPIILFFPNARVAGVAGELAEYEKGMGITFCYGPCYDCNISESGSLAGTTTGRYPDRPEVGTGKQNDATLL